MRRVGMSMIVIFISIVFSINAIGGSRYKLLKSKNLDYSAARRTQYNIEVPANTSDRAVKEILKQAVRDLAKKREVDALSVHLYLKDTHFPYAIATWAPDGIWSKAERGKPKSSFRTSIEIYPKNRPKESSKVEKFGLSLKKRKMIYREICNSQRRTRQIATRKYPSDFIKQTDYMRALDKKYEKKICEKYNITNRQKMSIVVEGVSNNWPD